MRLPAGAVASAAVTIVTAVAVVAAKFRSDTQRYSYHIHASVAALVASVTT
jgi:bacteriorhodopsin